MATFVLTLPVQSPEEMQIENFGLGASTSTPLEDEDVGKAVKLGAANNMLLCAEDDDLEGIVDSLNAETVNSGYGFGGVQRKGRALAYVGANQSPAMVNGALVVADAQAAVGTANTIEGPAVKTGTPTTFAWRCIRLIESSGAVGKQILIERV